MADGDRYCPDDSRWWFEFSYFLVPTGIQSESGVRQYYSEWRDQKISEYRGGRYDQSTWYDDEDHLQGDLTVDNGQLEIHSESPLNVDFPGDASALWDALDEILPKKDAKGLPCFHKHVKNQSYAMKIGGRWLIFGWYTGAFYCE